MKYQIIALLAEDFKLVLKVPQLKGDIILMKW